MRLRQLLPLLVLLTALVSSGCSDNGSNTTDGFANPGGEGQLSIDSPQEGEIVLNSPVTVTGKAAGLSQVTVNGESFPVEAGAFSAQVPLSDGVKAITVSGQNAQAQSVTVTVDINPPFIDLDVPTRGQFQVLGQDDRLLVRGRVVDLGTGVAGLTLDGAAIDLRSDGSFEVVRAPQVGLNVVNLAATDNAGRTGRALRGVVYGEFSPWEQPSSDAAEALVDPSAMAVIEAAALRALEDGIIDQLLAENLPQSNSFQILGVEYDDARIDLAPLDGRLHAAAELINLKVIVQIGDSGGNVAASSAELSGDIYISLTDSGSIETSFQSVEVELAGFQLNFADPPPQEVENALEVVLESVAENALTELISVFIIEELFDPSILSQEFTLLGISLPFEMKLTSLEIGQDGIGMRGDLDMPLEPVSFVPESPGALRTPSAPPSGRPSGMMRVAIADDMLNKVLGQAWRGGALNLEVRSLLGDDGELPIDLSVGPLALLVGNELRDQAPSDTPVDVEMRPLLPPIVTALDGDDRHLRIQLADLMLDLFLSPATGPRKQWATLAMVLTLDIGLSLDEEGKLKMDFDVDALAELEQEPLFELDNENVEIVMESLFKTLPTILGSQGLGGLFDLSSDDIFGISLAEIDVHSDGPNGDYISVEINLSSPE